MNKLRAIRNIASEVFTFLPFHLAIKISNLLMHSQGFGSGASVLSSGELRVAKQIFRDSQVDDLTIFDVGANRGEYAGPILELFPNARVFAFEPSSTTFKLLETKFGNHKRLTIFNFGLGKDNVTLPLYKCSKHARIASLTKLEITDDIHTEMVEVKKLDDVVVQIGETKIDLLKIDVEGHELDVLQGSETMLRNRNIMNIQYEFGQFNIDSKVSFRDLFDFVTSFGYQLSIVSPHKTTPLPSYHRAYEHFETTNLIATLMD